MLTTLHNKLRYDIRVLGLAVIAAPALLLLGIFLFMGLLLIMGVDPTRLFMAGLEILLPVAMSLIIATVCTQDSTLEIQLTFPRTFAATVVRRVLLALGSAGLVAFITTLLLVLLRPDVQAQEISHWPLILTLLGDQLIWLAPLLWFTALGLFITLLTNSRTASSSLLASIWLIEVLFVKGLIPTNSWLRPLYLFATTLQPTISFWLSSRIEILATALVFFGLSWLLLRNREHVLKGMHHD
ncbi:hypothetical protein ccbrp13_03570 [Ktedonobacteria bacterium brp13]|nr:hypothetical protein ccbrp13_03570 [Ktedonobacteria bacterium brp13]